MMSDDDVVKRDGCAGGGLIDEKRGIRISYLSIILSLSFEHYY